MSSSQQAPNVTAVARVIEGSGGGCFAAGTMVMLALPDRQVPIEQVKIGDTVWAFGPQGALECKKVIGVHNHSEEEVFGYRHWGGELRVTKNHWVLNTRNRFVPIGSLAVDDALVDFADHLCPILSIASLGKQTVYNLTVEGWHTYIADGIRVHNGGGGKSKGGSTRVAKEAANTLRSKAIAKVVDMLCEGPIRGLVNGAKSIFLDETPLYAESGEPNFSGVEVEFRTGEADQDYLPGFSEVQNEVIVNTLVQKADGRIVRSISNPDLDYVKIKILLPRLTEQNTSNGDLNGSQVDFRIELRPSGEGWRTIDFGYQWFSVAGTETFALSDQLEVTVSQDIEGPYNTDVTVTLEAQYRLVGAGSWTSLGTRQVTQRIRFFDDVPFEATYTGARQGNDVASATFTSPVLTAGQYEVQVVQGTSIGNLRCRQKTSTSIKGKCVSPVEFSYMVPLEGDAPWDISVTRLTNDPTSVSVNNEITWYSYSEVIDQKFKYSDTSVAGVQVDAELFGDKVPKRMYEIYGMVVAVPSNYDPETREYDGIWDGTFQLAWTDNPAWCLLDLLTNTRYGCGLDVATVDTAALYTISRYCDEMVPDGFGGEEPRFRLNCYIQTREEAYNLINTLVSAFRGMIYWAAGSVAVVQDSPRDVDLLVGRANVIGGDFNYSGSSLRSRHNTAIVTWNDPAQLYRAVPEVVELNEEVIRRGRIPTDVYAFGCTSRGQAVRFGKWILYSEWLETEMVVYNASFDHGEVMPGMVVGILDPTRSNVDFAGRLISTSGTTVVLDREVELVVGESYQLAVIDNTGAVQYRDIFTTGTVSTITVATAFDPDPIDGAMWSIFGTDVQPKLFRVLAVRETDKNTFEIAGLAHEPSKYDFIEEDAKLDPVPYSRFPTGELSAAGAISVEESLFKTNNMVRTRAIISWVPSTDGRVYQYELRYRLDNGQENIRLSSEPSYEILDMEVGTYSFEVRAIGAGLVSVPSVLDDFDILGKSAPPSDVEVFEATRQVTGAQLSWEPVTDLDLIGYEIRRGLSWDNYDAIIVERFVGTTLFVQIDDAEPYTYFIKAIDELGIYSDGAASVVASVSAPECPPVFEAVPQLDHILFRWTTVEGLGVEYEIREGISWDVGLLVARSSSDELSILDPASGTKTYWIKAVSRAGLYSDESRFAITTRALYTNRNVLLENENHEDTGSGEFDGFTHHMEVDAATLLLSTDPATTNFYQHGEHFFISELDQPYRARNWLDVTFINVIGGATTWDEWVFPWSDAEASIPWLPTGNLDGAIVTKYISWELDTLPDEWLYGFGMNGDLLDFRGGDDATEQVNATDYEDARYGEGLFISEFTLVHWEDLAVPEDFSMKFDFHLTTDTLETSVVFFELKDNTGGWWLRAGYNKGLDEFYLLDDSGNKISFSLELMAEDFVTIGVAQDGSTRRFFVWSAWTKSYGFDEKTYAALGTFDRLYLYET